MKQLHLLFLFLLIGSYCFAQADSAVVIQSKPERDDAVYKFGRVNIIKAAPVFHGIQVQGASLAYETGINVWPLSMNVYARYFAETDSSNGSIFIPEHLKLEIQPRFWGFSYLNGIFLSPVLVIYHTGELSFGGNFGYQMFITDKITAEAFIGMQSRSDIEHYDPPFFLRYGISFGFAFPKGVKSYGY